MLRVGLGRIGTGSGLSSSSSKDWRIGTCWVSSFLTSLIRVTAKPVSLVAWAARSGEGFAIRMAGAATAAEAAEVLKNDRRVPTLSAFVVPRVDSESSNFFMAEPQWTE